MSAPRKFRSFPGLLPLVLGGLLLAACAPTEGDDGSFIRIATTNTDFTTIFFVDTGNYPVTMDTGDFDGDGNLTDIAVVNWLRPGANSKDIADEDKVDGSLIILRNDDMPYNFTPSSLIDLGKYASIILAGDLDGGGSNNDLAVLVNDPSDPFVWICTDTSTDCLSPTSVSLSASHNAQAAQMNLVDLKNDGTANDLVLTIPGANEIVALVNDNSGAFTVVATCTDVATTPPCTSDSPGRFAVGNFDGVGFSDDLAILYKATSKILILLGDGTGTFTAHPKSPLDLQQRPKNIIVTDLNGTFYDDLAVTIPLRDEVSVFATTGAATFSGRGDFTVGDEPEFLVADDFEADGITDLFVLHNLEQFVTYMKGGAGSPPTYTTNTGSEDFVTRDPFAAIAGHFTGGAAGDLDLIVLGTDKRAVSVLAGDGAGGFSHTQIGFAETVRFPIAVDLDGAGESDLILLQPFSDRVVILINP